MMHAVVTAPNIFSPSYSISLEYISGCNHWDAQTLNSYLNAGWLNPYSQLVMSAIKPVLKEVFFDENEFTIYYYTWEHFASLLCRYYKCCSMKEDWNPIGSFIRKRISLLRYEDDYYTRFFKTAATEKDNWEPLKQGLFNGRYSDYFSTYEESEEFYKRNMVY